MTRKGAFPPPLFCYYSPPNFRQANKGNPKRKSRARTHEPATSDRMRGAKVVFRC